MMNTANHNSCKISTLFQSPNYQLIEKIGEGGFGQVYKAIQTSTQQTVAIKFLTLNDEFDPDKKQRYIERFHRESDLVRRLNHPNIVRLIDKGQQSDSLLYAVYEYIDGCSLKTQLDSQGALSAPEAADIMACVLDALSHAHDQGVIHRDIKPANIMIYKVGAKTHVKVLDFGIGTLKNEVRQLDYKSITLTQETIGTPSYSSPEQLRGEPPLAQTDVYVWGLVFLECITGTPTITGRSLAAIFHQQLSPANVPLGILAGHNSASFFRRVLNKKAQERPTNTAELYHEFRQFNFSNLVGDLSVVPDVIHHNLPAGSKTGSHFDETLINEGRFSYSRLTERKQISVLSVILNTKVTQTNQQDDHNNEQDVIDTFHADQMQQCIDIAIRYGANHVGSLGDTLLFYFGYPQVTDNDSRLCSRAALEISSNVNKKNSLLKNSQGITSHVKMGIQIGLMLSLANNQPEGKAAHDAMSLCRHAQPGQILCSENVKHILEGYLNFEGIAASDLNAELQLANIQALYQLRGECQAEAFGFLRGTRKNSAFIGREQEITSLLNLLGQNDSNISTPENSQEKEQTTQSIVAKLAHVHGEAGIGKSRLVFELRDRLSTTRHFVTQCLPEHKNNALYPILNLLKFKYSLDALSDKNSIARLKQAMAQTSLSTEHQQEGLLVLAAWLNLAVNLGENETEGISEENLLNSMLPELQKQRLFTVVSQLLCQVNQVQIESDQNRQHVFIFEDLHWADPTSHEFIQYMVQTDEFTLGQHAWINTSRESLPDAMAELSFTPVFIEKFDQSTTNEFIQYLFDQQTLAQRLTELLIERTDGIPLFIEELISTLQSQKLVHKVNGIIDFVNNDKQSQVPATLRDSLQQKLDGLTFAKDTAQLAATIGRTFDYDLLVATSDKDEAQVQIDLNELISTQLVYTQRQVEGDRYIFKHALVRDASYESMLKEVKVIQHSKVAETYHKHFPNIVQTDPALIADHYYKGDKISQAFQFGVEATKKQVEISNNEASVFQYEWTLNCLNKLTPSDSFIELELELELKALISSVMAETKGWGSNALVSLADDIDRLVNKIKLKNNNCLPEKIRPIANKAKWIMLTKALAKDDYTYAEKIGKDLLDDARANKDERLTLVVHAKLGQASFIAGDFANAREHNKKVIEIYDVEKDKSIAAEFGIDPLTLVYGINSLSEYAQGDPDKSLLSATKSFDAGLFTKHTMSIGYGYIFKALILCFLQKPIEANNIVKDYRDRFPNSSGESRWTDGMIDIIAEWCAIVLNKSVEVAKSETAIKYYRDNGQDYVLAWYEWLTADAYIHLKQYDKAINLMESAIERDKNKTRFSALPICMRYLAVATYYKNDKKLLPTVETYFKEAMTTTNHLNRSGFKKAHWLILESSYEYSNLLIQNDRKNEAVQLLNDAYQNVNTFAQEHNISLDNNMLVEQVKKQMLAIV